MLAAFAMGSSQALTIEWGGRGGLRQQAHLLFRRAIIGVIVVRMRLCRRGKPGGGRKRYQDCAWHIIRFRYTTWGQQASNSGHNAAAFIASL